MSATPGSWSPPPAPTCTRTWPNRPHSDWDRCASGWPAEHGSRPPRTTRTTVRGGREGSAQPVLPSSATRTPASAKYLLLPSSRTVSMPNRSLSAASCLSVRPAKADGGALRISSRPLSSYALSRPRPRFTDTAIFRSLHLESTADAAARASALCTWAVSATETRETHGERPGARPTGQQRNLAHRADPSLRPHDAAPRWLR